MTGIRNKAQKLEAANDAEVGHLHYLIRAILAITEPGEKALGADPPQTTENILVDIDLDGIRYLLIQMPVPDHNHNALSPRELEIARMVAQGHQNKIIANILNISTWTVCAHVRRIFAKLSVSSRAAEANEPAAVPWPDRPDLRSRNCQFAMRADWRRSRSVLA